MDGGICPPTATAHVSILEVTYSSGLVPGAAAAGLDAAAGTGAAAGAATGATGARGASGTFFSTSQLAGYTKIQGPSPCGEYTSAPKPFRKVPFWLSQPIFDSLTTNVVLNLYI